MPEESGTADQLLRDLEAQARDLEAANRYDTVDRRTVWHVVDGTVYNDQVTHGRLMLQVVARYDEWAEAQAFYGHKGPMLRRPPQMWISYVAVWEGISVPLRTRKQALRVMETKRLPRGTVLVIDDRVEQTDEELNALFADIARRSR